MHYNRTNFEDAVQASTQIWKDASFWPLYTFVQDAANSYQSPVQHDCVVNSISTPVFYGPRKDMYRKGKKRNGKLRGWGIRSDYQGTDLGIALQCGAVLAKLLVKAKES